MTHMPLIDNAHTIPARGHLDSFRTARDARTHASVAQNRETAEVRTARVRLDRVLDSGREMRTDVPRGYYLNIQV